MQHLRRGIDAGTSRIRFTPACKMWRTPPHAIGGISKMLSAIRGLTLWLPFLFSYLNTILGAPALSPLQPVLFTPSNANFTDYLSDYNGLLTLPSTNSTPSLGSIERWDYYVPSTTLMLRIAGYPPKTIDRAALGRTILAAQGSIRTHIKVNGDGELWDQDDRTSFLFVASTGPIRPFSLPACHSPFAFRPTHIIPHSVPNILPAHGPLLHRPRLPRHHPRHGLKFQIALLHGVQYLARVVGLYVPRWA